MNEFFTFKKIQSFKPMKKSRAFIDKPKRAK
jgi:hypothetical protein